MAAMLAACDSGPQTIEICAGTPTLAVYRDGEGPWQNSTPDAQGMHVLHVTDDFEFVVVHVQTSGSVYWWETRSTLNEMLAWQQRTKVRCETSDAQRVSVTGQLAQAGDVWMDNRGSTLTAPGSFSLSVGLGVHDLVATTGTQGNDGGRVLIRRDQSTDGPTTVPLVDIDVDGADLVPTTFTLSGLEQNESVSTSVDLIDDAHNDITPISERTGMTADTIPQELLRATDEQWISIGAALRGADVLSTDAQTSIDLLPPFAGVSWVRADGISASWEQVPVDTYNEAELAVIGSAGGTWREQYLFASREWLAKHGISTMSFDTDVPGLDVGWQPDVTKQFIANLSLIVDTASTSLWTAASTDQTLTPLPRMPSGNPFLHLARRESARTLAQTQR